MVTANKILTVSYGTFSCTLEGFDDPFSTMTDIAEYFRDLADDDRFFGAEPPRLDMAMLRMIAETRAGHAVAARPEEGGVVLSPSTAGAGAQDATAAGIVGVEAPAPQPKPDDMAEKLTHIRNVVAANRQSSAYFSEDEHAEDLIDDPTDDPTDPPADAFRTEVDDDTLAAAFRDDALTDEALGYRAFEETAVEVEALEVKAVEVKAGADAKAPEIEASETIETAETAQVGAVAATAPDHDTRGDDFATILTEGPPTGAAMGDGVEDPTDDVDAPAEPEVRTGGVGATSEAETPTGEQVETAPVDTGPIRERRAQQTEVGAAAVMTPAAAGAVNDLEDGTAVVEPAVIVADLGHDAAGPDMTGHDDLISGFLAGLDRDDDAEGVTGEGDDDILGLLSLDDDEEATDLDEDDLPAASAAIGATGSFMESPTEDTRVGELDGTDLSNGAGPVAAQIEDVGKDDAESADREAITAQSGAEAATDDVLPSGPDMERLFAATDSRLSGEDTSRRHANISHLKAAVAARRADGPIGPRTETETDAYRADLASSVRPRKTARPAEMPRAERPSRPAPLVLVSEQRVVETPDDDAPAAPVQPRRADRIREAETREHDTLLLDGTSAAAADFEQFASDVGATELPDILEAAAVYTARIMGQDNFSRPRLLHLAAEACDDLSREDGLRGFGQLLRDGRIRKVGRGTFALVGESRYAADADRRVG